MNTQVKEIHEIGSVISFLLNEKIPAILQPNTMISDIEGLIVEQFSKHNILTIKNFVIDGNTIPQHCHVSCREEIIHGFHYDKKCVENNSLLRVDLVGFRNGLYADAARTYCIGNVDSERVKLRRAAIEALQYIENVFCYGDKLSMIPKLLEEFMKRNYREFGIIHQYVGHFIGSTLHEFPIVPNRVQDVKNDFVLGLNSTLAIEPLITLHRDFIIDHYENGEVIARHSKTNEILYDFAVHVENTYVVTEAGLKSLTGDLTI